MWPSWWSAVDVRILMASCFAYWETQKYWKDRASELEQRKADAEERKKKIGLSGMKFTAQAMARR